MSRECSIVMYHYVRQLERTRWPSIKARRTSEFIAQLNYIQRHYNPITMDEMVHAVNTGEELPPKAVLLTFDDAYIDHYVTCFPILFDRGVQGVFFPPVAPVQHGKLLDVNRVHFILAACDSRRVGKDIDTSVREAREWNNVHKPQEYRAKWAQASRYDDAETIYVKRMLQTALPEGLRNSIARELFARYVTEDEEAFAGELYCTPSQLSVMQASGMYIGAHGVSHYWLNHVDEPTQREEVRKSLAFLREVGSPVERYWAMCYPYGAWDRTLLNILGEYGCSVGFTTEVGTTKLDDVDALLLPRYDTNDFPME